MAEDALDALAVGVVCLNAAGDAVFLNARARRIADARDGFEFDGDRPTSSSASSRSALRDLLAVALGDHAALRPVPSGPLLIPRASGRAPYRVDVTPVRRGVGHGDGQPSSGAILFIVDPTTQPATSVARLVAAFGLTASEAAVAAAVAAGRSLAEIAEGRRVSVQTIRTQLKQAFSKTGTSRQSALTALVARTASPASEPLP